MATVEDVRVQDAMPVHSRVSWGGIIAGAAVGVALYLLLAALGAAIGLSASEEGTLGARSGLIYAFVTSLVSLFVGGWTASQFTVGESKFEATIYGVILWAVVVMGLGAFSVIGVTNANMISQFAGGTEITEQAQAKMQLQQEQKQQQQEQSAQGSQPQQEQKKERASVAWYGFAGILLTMVASILGSLVGSGPNMVARWGVSRRRTEVYVPPTPPPAR